MATASEIDLRNTQPNAVTSDFIGPIDGHAVV